MPTVISDLLVLAFEGMTAPPNLLDRVRPDPPAGITHFTEDNIHDVTQAREIPDT